MIKRDLSELQLKLETRQEEQLRTVLKPRKPEATMTEGRAGGR